MWHLCDFLRLFHIVNHKVTKITAGKRIQHTLHQLAGNQKLSLNQIVNIEQLLVSEVRLKEEDKKIFRYLEKMYLQHRFDLLGSGWVCTNYGAKVLGFQNHIYPNRWNSIDEYFNELKKYISKKEMKQIIDTRSFISSEYQPICWSRDFKSGYSWKLGYLEEHDAIHTPNGADVKTVWELGRLQFLFQTALGCLCNPDSQNQCIQEFKDIILDFISANPIGIGIQWTSPMDAAIRAMSMLLSYDIYFQLDKSNKIGLLDDKFIKVFTSSIYQHGVYIYSNLEKDIFNRNNGNHYYSNLVGLLYISLYLEGNNKSYWFDYASKEFIYESSRQFFEDGSNIEASTSYHRLMFEMFTFGTAALIRKRADLPKELENKLIRASIFAFITTKKNGNAIQIGDNDSGRFVKSVSYGTFMSNRTAEKLYENLNGFYALYGEHDEYFDENTLNHKETLDYFNGLYQLYECFPTEISLSASLICVISNRIPVKIHVSLQYLKAKLDNRDKYKTIFTKEYETLFSYLYSDSSGENDWGYFPGFGLFYYKNQHIDFYLYTGGDGQRKRIGHSHNDILHCELCIDKQDVIYDRGTYVYTASDCSLTDLFRKSIAHFVPYQAIEPRDIIGTFGYSGEEYVEVLEVSEEGIHVLYRNKNGTYSRQIKLSEGTVRIIDKTNHTLVEKPIDFRYTTSGYGKLQKININ